MITKIKDKKFGDAIILLPNDEQFNINPELSSIDSI